MKRRILLTIADGFHYRYLVQTEILKSLYEQNEALFIFAPKNVYDALTSLALPRHIAIQTLEDVPLTRLRQAHLFLRSCMCRELNETQNIKSEIENKKSPLRWRIRQALTKIFSATHFDPSSLIEAVWSLENIQEFAKRERVDLVVTSTPGQKIFDLPFLLCAKRLNIESVSPVYSWDNLTAKGPLAIAPDRLVVWNDVMKQEALTYHGYGASSVSVGGVPVFDPYFDLSRDVSDKKRAIFLKALKLDPTKKLITLTTIPAVYFGSSHRVLAERIISLIRSGDLPPSSLLIRPHPMDETPYDDLCADEAVLDTYGSTPRVDPRRWTPAENNTRHLGRTMAYSDVVINIASTITVDAACFDTPVINVAFDLKPEGDEYQGSVARYYDYTHYKKVVDTGAAALVTDEKELASAIRTYLEDPTKDRLNRELLVKKQVGVLDGGASARTAAAIMNIQTE